MLDKIQLCRPLKTLRTKSLRESRYKQRMLHNSVKIKIWKLNTFIDNSLETKYKMKINRGFLKNRINMWIIIFLYRAVIVL